MAPQPSAWSQIKARALKSRNILEQHMRRKHQQSDSWRAWWSSNYSPCLMFDKSMVWSPRVFFCKSRTESLQCHAKYSLIHPLSWLLIQCWGGGGGWSLFQLSEGERHAVGQPFITTIWHTETNNHTHSHSCLQSILGHLWTCQHPEGAVQTQGEHPKSSLSRNGTPDLLTVRGYYES